VTTIRSFLRAASFAVPPVLSNAQVPVQTPSLQPDSGVVAEALRLHRAAARDPEARERYARLLIMGGVVLPAAVYYTDAALWRGEAQAAAVRRGDSIAAGRLKREISFLMEKADATGLLATYGDRLKAMQGGGDSAAVATAAARLYAVQVTLWQGLPIEEDYPPSLIAERSKAAAGRKAAARERTTEALNRVIQAEQRLKAAEGGHYEGQSLGGRPEGRGVLVYPNGDRYDGAFHEGRRHGRGVFEFANGVRYDGEFVQGQLQGPVVIDLPSGTRYTGESVQGARSGQGTLELATGERYTGGFANDRFEGRGVLEYADGGRYDGEWREGKRQGEGMEYYANGRVLRGRFDNDRLVSK